MPFIAVFFAIGLALFSYPIHPTDPTTLTQAFSQLQPTPTPTLLPTPTPQLAPAVQDSTPWGQAQQIGEHTYHIRVENDAQMATPAEILVALNTLRIRSGVQSLSSDPKLCAYAQSRADLFNSIKSTDEHAGFNDFLENQDGFSKLGYRRVGENSSYGYVMSGVHLIEFVYMQSAGHNRNQLDPDWDHACVGVSGKATNLIFATSPL